MSDLKIIVLIPMSGPSGLFGPSARDCALLAAEEINECGGILGSSIMLDIIDAGNDGDHVVNEIEQSLSGDTCAIIGTHDSAVRNVICRYIDGKIPYIYTPPYEGDESRDGVFVLGETPFQQLSPVIPWFKKNLQANTWYLVGDNYQWPYITNWLAKQYIGLIGGEVLGEEYFPYGSENFDHAFRQIELLKPDVVLITLVGNDAINFNREFSDKNLADISFRFGPLIEENTLLGIGIENSKGIYSASSYFTCLQTTENRQFMDSYMSRFGSNAPMLNVVGFSCYEGLHYLSRLTAKARSLDVQKLSAISEGFVFTSPRGIILINNRHSTKTIFLAEADGIDFNIIETFPGVPANAPGR